MLKQEFPMKPLPWPALIRNGLLIVAGALALASQAVTIPNTPLSVQQSVKPMVMLVSGKDHRFFYEAYNDASDIDGDGVLDIRFKPSITYFGLFNPGYCYTHNDKNDNSGLFTPDGLATADGSGGPGKCPGKWSGNWLNYVTTSRIDALKAVLYGGTREVDTASQTILRRTYIPQDAHSWAKEYTSQTVDKYKISDYTPLAQPSSGKRHFFGNLTRNAGMNCATLSNCSNTLPPVLSIVTNSDKRVWDWASSERPVLRTTSASYPNSNFGTGTRTDRTVRVAVCTGSYTGGCKQYPNGNYKPVGLLHDYGEADAMLFGLLTGSYDQNMAGGRLRKVVSSFKDEVDASTGVFTANAKIVQTFDRIRIRDFNNTRTDNAYRSGWLTTAAPTAGQFVDWGNPIGEMMYEAVRYFAGKGSATTAFAGSTTKDTEVGLSFATWDDPYSNSSAAKAPYCARGNLLTISDINVSYDSDQLPGVNSNFGSGIGTDLTGLNVSTEANFITANEPSVPGLRFIGQVGSLFDSAPSPKSVSTLSNIRGLAPEEPTKQGSYYAASVARYAKRTDLRPSLSGNQTLDTFVVALSSPLPRIEVPLSGGKKITLVPFAKSVSGASISAAKGAYQPTNQIVDFYVDTIANSGPADANASVNGGRYYAKFRINFEDVEQGADHDMDAIVEYTVQANPDDTVSVILRPTYEAGGIRHRIGYVISGTTADGVYLEVQDESDTTPYFLNTPPGKAPGYCDPPWGKTECNRLPYIGGSPSSTPPMNQATRVFTPGEASSATLLKDPLWYAAKWGGFIDRNGNSKPDLNVEWDADGDGVPDTYFLVQNPLKLKESLKRTLDNIAARSSSASNISANSTSISSSSRLFQAVFNTQRWSGDLIAYPATAAGVGSTPAWQAADELPAWNARNIFMRTASTSTVKLSTYAALPADDQTALVNVDIFQYLLGNRTKEIQNGGTLRDRGSPLGDIVHSSPYFDKVNNAIFVGANDGALHAFDAANGKELFAFIPRSSVARLKNLASIAYDHEYFVDGEVIASPRATETGNKMYLFTLLGRGGKGLFAIDASNPASFAASNFLWEYTPEGSVTAAADGDLGLMLGRPAAVKLNNGKFGLLVGNGYNSGNGKAVLYIFILNADGSINQVEKIDTTIGGDNGLAGVFAVDEDGNGSADFVYGGDLKGNVWRFDISSANPASWGLSYSGLPLFTAQDASNNPQPITAPMYAAKNNKTGDPNYGKWFVFFGTGSYFKAGDIASTQTQSWYGITVEASPVSGGRASLKARTIDQVGTIGGNPSRAFSAATPGDMTGKRGWYIDWDNPIVGERVVTGSKLVQFVVPTLMASSMYPIASDPCVPGGKGYLNFVDPWSGAATPVDILDVNGDNNFTNDRLGGDVVGSVDVGVGIPTEALPMTAGGRVIVFVGGSGTSSNSGALIKNITGLGAASFKGRVSWREIIRD
jgi:type IV pilus assembly protein PilY1